jgi:WD40 repeat protein
MYLADSNLSTLRMMMDCRPDFAAFSPSGTYMAFTGPNRLLYVLNLVDNVILSSPIGPVFYFEWCPNSEKLAVLVHSASLAMELYISELSSAELLAISQAPTPADVPLAGIRRAEEIISVVGTHIPLPMSQKIAEASSICWSPDGKNIAYNSFKDSCENVFLVNLENRTERQITQRPGHTYVRGWSPDGKCITFESQEEESTYVTEIDRNEERKIASVAWEHFWKWLSNGTILLRASETRLANQLVVSVDEYFLVSPTGDNRRRLLIPDTDSPLAWSPDQRKIAFTSVNEKGLQELYVSDADGSHLRRLFNCANPKQRIVRVHLVIAGTKV